MRKTIFIIAAVAAMACACNKSETVKIETPNQISFAQANQGFVKSSELTGDKFRAGWVMHVSATRRNNIGDVVNGAYFTDQVFETADPTADGAKFVCAAPKYWPVGTDKLDFIAFACYKDSVSRFGDYNFDATTAAGKLTFSAFETYPITANPYQIDLVYAVKNGVSAPTAEGTATELEFKHAQALLEFKAKTTLANSKVYIDSIWIKGLKTKGKFIIENTRIQKDTAYWELDETAAGDTIPGCCADSVLVGKESEFKTVGKTLLIPEQERQEISILYHVVKPAASGATGAVDTVGERLSYTFSGARGAWAKGKKYTYNLTVDPMEIIFTEKVTAFEDGDSINIPESETPVTPTP